MRIIFPLAMLTQLSNAASDPELFPNGAITPEGKMLFEAFLNRRRAEEAVVEGLFDKNVPTTTERALSMAECEILLDTYNGVRAYAQGILFYLDPDDDDSTRSVFVYYTTQTDYVTKEQVVAYKYDPDISNLREIDIMPSLIKNFENASDAINFFFGENAGGQIIKINPKGKAQETKIRLVERQFQWNRPGSKWSDKKGLALRDGIQWKENYLQKIPEKPCQLVLKGLKEEVQRRQTISVPKDYVFECADTKTRDTFYECLENVLKAYKELDEHEIGANQSRRRLTSRPIRMLKDTISNLN